MKRPLKVLLLVISGVISLLILEGGLRFARDRLGIRLPVVISAAEVLEKSWYAPHPYLTYVFKPNVRFVMDYEKFGNPLLTFNAFSFRSTREFDVRAKTKPRDVIRVVALGGSTTMGVNNDNEIWPYLVGRGLQAELPGHRVEVLNEGTMGYTSLDNLIDLGIRVIDFEADVFILYLGVNDFGSAAPPGYYRSDHAHFRRTLFESLHYSPAELFPPFLFKSVLVQYALWLAGVPDRQILLDNTGTSAFRKVWSTHAPVSEEMYAGVTVDVIRNLKSMVALIRTHRKGAIILMSSFYRRDDPKIVRHLNLAIRALAEKENLVFVDPAGRLDRKRRLTFDAHHFTPEGDRLMAQIMVEGILQRRELLLGQR